MFNGLAQPPQEESTIDGFGFGGKQAQGDLRSGAVMGDAHEPVARIDDTDGISGLAFAAVGEVAREDPGMAAGRSIGGFAIRSDGGKHLGGGRPLKTDGLPHDSIPLSSWLLQL